MSSALCTENPNIIFNVEKSYGIQASRSSSNEEFS
jgi:hypothetical protein